MKGMGGETRGERGRGGDGERDENDRGGKDTLPLCLSLICKR